MAFSSSSDGLQFVSQLFVGSAIKDVATTTTSSMTAQMGKCHPYEKGTRKRVSDHKQDRECLARSCCRRKLRLQ